TLSQLMLYTPQGIKTWKPSTSFHLSFVVQDRLYIREVGRGLMEMRDGTLRLIPGGERFAQERIYTMVPWGEAAASTPGKTQRILIGTRSQGFFILDGTALAPFSTELDKFLKRTLLYHGALLPDGTLALATTGGGLAILGKDGRCVKILDKKLGLQDDVVRYIYVDRQSGIWLGLDNGLSRVEWPSPLSHFDDQNGLNGYSMDIRRHNGRLHVGTAQGTFVLNPAAPASGPTGARFSAIEGIKEQCWQILPVEDVALVVNLQGVFEVRGAKAGLVLPVSAKSLSRSKRDPSRIFIGLREGLTSMYRHGNGQPWTDEGKIPGISENAHTMLEAEEGVLWLGTQSQGVLRITFPKDWQGSAASRETPRVERFGLEQGLPSLNFNYVFQVGGKPVFATKKGVYSFQEESHRFVPDPRFDRLFPEAPRWILTIREDSQGRVWMHAQDEVNNVRETGFALRQPDGSYRWEAAPLRRLSESTIEYIFPDDHGVVWLGGSDGLFRYDPRVPKDPAQSYKALLRRVTQKGNQLLFSGARGSAVPEPALKFRENALRFEFAAPSFDLESANRYQVLLEGFDSTWSPWSAEPFKEYTNLHEGTYRFRVRAMNTYGQMSQEDMYPFRVLPPWYRSGWAFFFYLGLGSFTLWAVSRARTRILVARNRILRAQIGEATRGLQAQAEDLERMNGELRLLNEQKNQFFGIATHDLRNPLNGIVIEAQLIDGEEDLQVIHQAAQNIHREGLEMSALIERFLNIAAIESGGIKTEKARFDLWKVAEHLVNRHAAWAREKGIGIRMEPLEGHGTVFADLKFTKEVLDNLISNALKFSPPGKAVSVHVKGGGKRVLVSVRDQGPGLTEADKARLFGRFAKLSAQPTGGEKSTGLGLSIVKHMVEAMEGRIWVDSEPGSGATFQVELPAATAP
ncbi:MAG: hypothetical protein KGN80_09640, partial [Acidobacteriota bacterium]|nr:hypothetical protein [Acidobacteriota bacterium]